MKKLTGWEKLLFILSIFVVTELYISSIINYPENIRKWALIIDTSICFVFLFDFFRGLVKTRDKLKFIRNNWIDFISSIPMIGILRIGRVVKIFRVLRVMRSGKLLYSIFSRDNSINALKNMVLLIMILIMIFSVSVYQLEKDLNPYFDSLGQAVWWTIHTTITFGFVQDIAPISIEGKFISLVLILMGMVLFGTFISTVTDYFIEEEDILNEVKTLKQMIQDLNDKIESLGQIKGP